MTGWVDRLAADRVSKSLSADGTKLWQEERLRVNEAIGKIERAWALTQDPLLAVQLCTMYDQANRNQDALVLLREAVRAHPRHALLRHHAAITLLRHGAAEDVRDFFDSVLQLDPDDAFAQIIVSLLEAYDPWVRELVQSIASVGDHPPFVIAVPVWGQPFTDHFVRFCCASLLSPNNLPELAKRHSVHLVIFTSVETERFLAADPLFARLQDYATVRFVRYSEAQVGYGKAMEAAYGCEPVHYSDRSLAFYYARNCKFALMSCAHYVAMAAGRIADAIVSCHVADTMLNDGALTFMAERLAEDVDAVMLHGIQLPADALRPLLERDYRRDDGSLQLSSADCERLLIDHLPQYNFASPDGRARVPLRLCWRAGADGVLFHGNHYHPIALRPAAFDHPLRLTIDPVDSRFVDRTSLDLSRLHIVQDSSIVALSLEQGPAPEQLQAGALLSADDMAFWLWGYWGRLRPVLFQLPLRFGARSEAWLPVEAAASEIVGDIVRRAARLEDENKRRATWRL
ncbi:MAG: hypothetical protein U1E60_00920 [Reyranellaceae bacterium]